VAVGIPLATSIAGIAMAAHATRDYDRRGFQSPGSPAEPGSAGAAGAANAASSALLRYDGSRWFVDAPLPIPTPRPFEDPAGQLHWRPGIALELVRVRF